MKALLLLLVITTCTACSTIADPGNSCSTFGSNVVESCVAGDVIRLSSSGEAALYCDFRYQISATKYDANNSEYLCVYRGSIRNRRESVRIE